MQVGGHLPRRRRLPRPGSSADAVPGRWPTTTASACRAGVGATDPERTARTGGAQVHPALADAGGQLLATACMPAGGQADVARGRSCATSRSRYRLEVASSASSRTPARKGRKKRSSATGRRAPPAGPARPVARAAQQPGDRCEPGPRPENAAIARLPGSEGRCGERPGDGARVLPRVDHPVRPAAVPHDRPPPEPPQIEGGQVEVGGHPRVAGVEHLEAAVDDEAVDPLGGSAGHRRGTPASSTCTSHPAAARRVAADSPASPAPTTTTSARDGGGTASTCSSRARSWTSARPVDNLGGEPADRLPVRCHAAPAR